MIVVVMLISLIGLAIMQLGWLNKAIETNRQLFKQKIDLVAQRAGDIYRNDTEIPSLVHTAIVNNSSTEMIDRELNKIIDLSFREFNINLDYDFGIYKHQENNRSRQILVAGNVDIDKSPSFSCIQNVNEEYGWASLTCNQGYGRDNAYHLAIFPSYNDFIINEVKGTLFTTILFILFILFGFYYMLRIINKQKKISEIKNDFINNLSHEFKTPIFSISLASKALRKSRSTTESENFESYIDVIDSEGLRLKNQVDKILQLSLLDSEKFYLNKKEVNIHEQLKSISDNFKLILKEKNGRVEFDFKATNSIIQADEVHLKNVWYNLIDNAIKYNDRSPKVVIKTLDSNEDTIEVVFEDNGIGMSAKQCELIFDKFYRIPTGNIHKADGFGVGLSYVKGIIERHKGKIMVSSEKNKGSVFKIILPGK
ncbi:MAG: HAMP domain-containing sensor histidine kinase [Bacteroidota bacterium]